MPTCRSAQNWGPQLHPSPKRGIKEEVEELESERAEPLVIPLESLVPCVPLSNPHHHLQVDITLPRPIFAQDLVWSLRTSPLFLPSPSPSIPRPRSLRSSPFTERTSGPAVGLFSPAEIRPQTSSQDSNSQEAAGEYLTPFSNSGRSPFQVGTPGFHNLPIQAMVRITQRNTDVQPKRLSGQMRCKSGNVGDNKTLKDLFKTFDPTSSPFGQ